MVFVGEPTPEDVAAVEHEAKAAARDSGVVEAIRDGVSIARLVDIGDHDGAAIIADQYVLTLGDLAPQLGPLAPAVATPIDLVALGYILAAHCNSGDYETAHRVCAEYGITLDAVTEAVSRV